MKTARVKIVNVRPKLKLVDGHENVVRAPLIDPDQQQGMVSDLFNLITDDGIVGYGVAICHEDGTTTSGFTTSDKCSKVLLSGALDRAKSKIDRWLDEAAG